MASTYWRFDALDTLFFRDGRPLNAGESAWVDSLFPPNGFTLQGAIRTAILSRLGADFAAFGRGEPCLPNGISLKQELGDADGIGQMRLAGPFLIGRLCDTGDPALPDEELFFPAPLDLVHSERGFELLAPARGAESDVGMLSLTRANGRGAKPLEGQYVAGGAMEHLLAGTATRLGGTDVRPLFGERRDDRALADREPKIGLARENERRTAKEGMLYAIAPVRPRRGTALIVTVDGVDTSMQPEGRWAQKLGGEGKLAVVEVRNAFRLPAAPELTVTATRVHFKLVLTTPASFSGASWLPDGFVKRDGYPAAVTFWAGSLNGIEVTILSACVGRAVKIGGWDLVANRPRDLVPFVPAGSVYFCEAAASDMERLRALHGSQIGRQVEYGFGHVLVGRW